MKPRDIAWAILVLLILFQFVPVLMVLATISLFVYLAWRMRPPTGTASKTKRLKR